MANKVLKKYIYLIEASLTSPLCISNGDSEVTDLDVIKDAQGRPFIPGSSLAGAMRGYIDKTADESCIFGYEGQNQRGQMSSVYVSDFTFTGEVPVRVRDSVALNERKAAISGAKFDMEVIDSGAYGYFFLEMVIRENDDAQKMAGELQQVLWGWKCEDIRLGAKKTRGYGELKLTSVKKKAYDASNILSYADVYKAGKDGIWKEETSILDALIPNHEMTSKYVTLELPLKLEGGISIRQYGVKKGEPDFVHLTANGKPVIPGTSMTGAIRHRITSLLQDLKVQNVQAIVDGMFGSVHVTNGVSESHKSMITVSECILVGEKPLTMIRNGISRFESGAKKGALFKELSYVGGTTTLRVKVECGQETKAVIGFLLLAFKDLQNGYLAVGGQTSVGRGLFEANGELKITGMEESEEEYMKEAFLTLQLAEEE